MHHALYQTYRPTRFADLLGQTVIAQLLTTAISADKVAHAYLFSGSRGTGKTTTARLLARGVNCLSPTDGEPDNTCEMCQGAATGSLLDIIEIDAASNRGIDEMRELRDKVQVTPAQAKRKVYIIDEVHMLTKEAFNALLKTLEEPPDHAMFVLATTEPQKVPATIQSRCQRFDFRPAPVSVLANHLASVAGQEKLELEAAAATTIATYARGSFRDALSILDVVISGSTAAITETEVRRVLGLPDAALVSQLERALAVRDRPAALTAIQQAVEQGADPVAFRHSLVDYLRALLLARAGGSGDQTLTAAAADWDFVRLTAALRSYLEASDLPASGVPQLPLELATLEILVNDVEAARVTPAAIAPSPASAIKSSVSPPLSSESASVPASSPESTSVTEPATPAEPSTPEPNTASPDDQPAVELWEKLLQASKSQYSLLICLQRTRPLALTTDQLTLAVQSDFFLKKLTDAKTKARVEELATELSGRPLRLKLELGAANAEDVFDQALSVFEGAQVE